MNRLGDLERFFPWDLESLVLSLKHPKTNSWPLKFEQFMGNGSKIAQNFYTPKVFHVFAPGKSMVGRWILSFRDGHPFREGTSSKLDLLGQYKGYIEGNPRSVWRDFANGRNWVQNGEREKKNKLRTRLLMHGKCLVHDSSWWFVVLHHYSW